MVGTIIVAGVTLATVLYGNFDLVLGTISRAFLSSTPTPHVPWATPYLVPMLIGC